MYRIMTLVIFLVLFFITTIHNHFILVQGEYLVFDGVVDAVTYQTDETIKEAPMEAIQIIQEINQVPPKLQELQEKSLNHKNPFLEFQCHLCYKQFSKKYYLNRHIKNHDKKSTTICYICGKTLKSAINLHMKAVHENVRPFRCDFCGKTFREKNRLRLHMMVHSGTSLDFFLMGTKSINF